jgi:hypothetical protein
MSYTFQSKSLPELFELVENYNPEIVWSDGDSGKLFKNS